MAKHASGNPVNYPQAALNQIFDTLHQTALTGIAAALRQRSTESDNVHL